jgi:hypothetical protein
LGREIWARGCLRGISHSPKVLFKSVWWIGRWVDGKLRVDLQVLFIPSYLVEGGLTAPGTRSNRPGSSGEIWFFEEIFCEHACLDQRILWLKSQVVLSWFALVSIDLVFPGRRGLTAPSM